MHQNTQYILYLRKSTDDRKLQKLSLPAQNYETRELASRCDFPIFKVFTDSKTAKYPGRPNFNKMVEEIKRGYGYPVGIICYSVDRLTRNRIDEEVITSLLDSGKLADLQFRNFRFENNATGRFLLDIQFAEARYHISKHAEGLAKTIDEKLRRGQYPGAAFFGWRYNDRIKNIEPHRKEGPFVLRTFREFATGKYSIRSMTLWLKDEYRRNRLKRRASLNGTCHMLRNVIYKGLIPWKGKIHEGTFTPIVSTRLFQKVQDILDGNRCIRKVRPKHDFPFCGIFRCSCGSMITAQYAKKRRYIYYRCSRKLNTTCEERYVRSEVMADLVRDWLKRLSLSANWGSLLNEKIEALAQQSKGEVVERHTAISKELIAVSDRLKKLMNLNLDGLINDETFREEHERLIDLKNGLRSQIRECETESADSRLEPMRDVVKTLQRATELDLHASDQEMSQILRKTGTNHHFSNGLVQFELVPPFDSVAQILAQEAKTRESKKPVASAANRERKLV